MRTVCTLNPESIIHNLDLRIENMDPDYDRQEIEIKGKKPAALAVADLCRCVNPIDELFPVPLDQLRDPQAFVDIGAIPKIPPIASVSPTNDFTVQRAPHLLRAGQPKATP